MFQRNDLAFGICVRDSILAFCGFELHSHGGILLGGKGFRGLQITYQFVDYALQAHVGAPRNEVRGDSRCRGGQDKKHHHHFYER